MEQQEPIPLVDLKSHVASVEKETLAAIKRVLQHAHFVLGNEVEEFEKAFAVYCGTRYAVGVGNGLDALRLALIACGIQKGDHVLLPANTFIATALAVSQVGALPRLVDIDPITGLMDNNALEESVKKEHARSIIPVHLYGQMIPMDIIMEIAKRHNLIIIEDAAQAHGAEWQGKKSGSWGDAGCFSFYPSKNLGAFGDAGIVVTNNETMAEKIRSLRNYGEEKKYVHRVIGMNSRLDALQAAILNAMLPRLDEWNKKRRVLVAQYRQELSGLDPHVRLLGEHAVGTHAYHLFVIRSTKRDELQTWLRENHIETGIHYPCPIHLQPAYTVLGYKQGDFPHTESFANEILSLPLYPELTEESVHRVTEKIKTFFF